MGSYREWVYPGLLLFGIAFNWFVQLAEHHGWTEGYLSLYVAAGSAITIGGIWALDSGAGKLTLLCFFLAGLPMMIGSIARYVHKRELTQERYRKGRG
jgi:hypothetical protein